MLASQSNENGINERNNNNNTFECNSILRSFTQQIDLYRGEKKELVRIDGYHCPRGQIIRMTMYKFLIDSHSNHFDDDEYDNRTIGHIPVSWNMREWRMEGGVDLCLERIGYKYSCR